jgi:hypothetical protein
VALRAVWRNADIAVLLALRFAARRSPPHHAKIARAGGPGPAAQGRNRFFASPALALQLASSPRDRAGLLPTVPLRGTGIGCGGRCGMPSFAKGAKDGASSGW